jgi:hypothetical protein
MRGGPGLGNIAPSQGDYFQVVKTAGHGNIHPIDLAPATVQEAIDLTGLAFDLWSSSPWSSSPPTAIRLAPSRLGPARSRRTPARSDLLHRTHA